MDVDIRLGYLSRHLDALSSSRLRTEVSFLATIDDAVINEVKKTEIDNKALIITHFMGHVGCVCQETFSRRDVKMNQTLASFCPRE